MTVRILVGDCRERLREMPPGSVHAVVTSPPFYGLRDYGVDGQLGLEPTPDEYVAAMVAVFAEVRRVLRDDGTAWLNLGDSYAGSNQTGGSGRETITGGKSTQQETMHDFRRGGDVSPGSLLGIPWRVAFALQADGWLLRSSVVWAKPNPMPESVAGWRFEGDKLRRGSWRCTSSYEHVFMLAKGMGYFANQEAVREDATREASGNVERKVATGGERQRTNTHLGSSVPWTNDGSGRNPRDVWTITTKPFSGAHFAVFPPDLPERCIRASTADKVCAACGAPWAVVVERERGEPVEVRGYQAAVHNTTPGVTHGQGSPNAVAFPASMQLAPRGGVGSSVLGSRPTCACNADTAPAVVLDPFAGAGTTLLVADRLGRDAIGIELNADYAELARQRIAGEQPMFADVEVT